MISPESDLSPSYAKYQSFLLFSTQRVMPTCILNCLLHGFIHFFSNGRSEIKIKIKNQWYPEVRWLYSYVWANKLFTLHTLCKNVIITITSVLNMSQYLFLPDTLCKCNLVYLLFSEILKRSTNANCWLINSFDCFPSVLWRHRVFVLNCWPVNSFDCFPRTFWRHNCKIEKS